MKRILPVVGLLALAAGCLSPAPPAPAYWTVEPKAAPVFKSAAPRWDRVRLTQVTVRAPFDGSRLTVLRPDGSLAFDPFNSFASQPSALLKGTVHDIVSGSGLFGRTLNAVSAASARYTLETTVTRLALDCRVEGVRTATAGVSLTLLDGRDVVSVASGEGSMPAGDGNYSAAFSAAFTQALAAALSKL